MLSAFLRVTLFFASDQILKRIYKDDSGNFDHRSIKHYFFKSIVISLLLLFCILLILAPLISPSEYYFAFLSPIPVIILLFWRKRVKASKQKISSQSIIESNQSDALTIPIIVKYFDRVQNIVQHIEPFDDNLDISVFAESPNIMSVYVNGIEIGSLSDTKTYLISKDLIKSLSLNIDTASNEAATYAVYLVIHI